MSISNHVASSHVFDLLIMCAMHCEGAMELMLHM